MVALVNFQGGLVAALGLLEGLHLDVLVALQGVRIGEVAVHLAGALEVLYGLLVLLLEAVAVAQDAPRLCLLLVQGECLVSQE